MTLSARPAGVVHQYRFSCQISIGTTQYEEVKCLRARLKRTTDHQAPGAAGQILCHQDHKASRAPAKPEPEPDQVRPEELHAATGQEDAATVNAEGSKQAVPLTYTLTRTYYSPKPQNPIIC